MSHNSIGRAPALHVATVVRFDDEPLSRRVLKAVQLLTRVVGRLRVVVDDGGNRSALHITANRALQLRKLRSVVV